MPKVPAVPPAQTMSRHSPRCLPAGASARTGTEEAATVTAVVASRGRVGSAGKGGAPLSLLGKQEEFHLGTNWDGRVKAAGALHGKYCPWGGTRGQTYYQELI